MTRSHELDPGFEPRVADWLETDPGNAPNAVLDTVLAAFPSIPQRRSTRMRWRSPTMNRLVFLAAATATVTVSIVAVTGGVFSPGPNTVVASASPTETAAPTASPSATSLPSPHFAGNGLIAMVRSQQLVLVDPVSGKTTRVLVDRPAAPPDEAAYAATDLAWSPDGRRLAYVSHEGPVYVIDTSGGTPKRIWGCGIEADGCTIAWSPDGTRIAVGHGTELTLIDPDGSNETTFGLPVASVYQPTWAPDGTRLAFHSISVVGGGGLEDQDRRLYIVDRDGSNLTAIGGPGKGYGFWDPAWSPGGRSIAYLGSTQHRSCSSTVKIDPCLDDWLLHLTIVDLDGSPPRDIVDAGVCLCLGFTPGMTVSPDGRQAALVVPSGSDRPWGLEIVNVDGTEMRPVADGWGPVAWQPVP